MSILIKRLFHIILLAALPLLVFGQKDKRLEKTWRSIHDENRFGKDKNFNGPSGEYGASPSEINENEAISSGSVSSRNTPYKGLPYDEKTISQGHGNGSGTLKADPDVVQEDPVKLPEADAPDVNPPDIDGPEIGEGFWQVLFVILILALLALIIYYFLKNRQPSNKPIPFEPLDEDLNPATISKTELELRLEEAMARGNYKECVRIYFLFAMKDLIEKRRIFWKKEKTNVHYQIELTGKPEEREFGKIVAIYDLVWYGDYTVTREIYDQLQPLLDKSYKHIEAQR